MRINHPDTLHILPCANVFFATSGDDLSESESDFGRCVHEGVRTRESLDMLLERVRGASCCVFACVLSTEELMRTSGFEPLMDDALFVCGVVWRESESGMCLHDGVRTRDRRERLVEERRCGVLVVVVAAAALVTGVS